MKSNLLQSMFPNPKSYSILAWIYIFISICFLFYTCVSGDNEDSIIDIDSNRTILQVTQCLFCLIAIFSGYKINSNQEESTINQEENKYEEIKKGVPRFKDKSPIAIKGIWDKAKRDTESFRNLILFIWLTWGAYFFYAALIVSKDNTNTMFDVPLEVLFNNITFIAFFSCFYKLDLPESKVNREKIIPWLAAILIVFVIHSVLLKFSYPEITNSLFLFLSGILNAVAISVFIGRLESKNISPPRIYVWVMFIYAALQPLIIISSFGEINLLSSAEPLSKNHMMIIANVRLWLLAIGKGMFFLLTLWLFESKRLIYYFMVTPELKKDRDTFEKFKQLI